MIALQRAVVAILGIVGLRKRRATPVIEGSVHAWIGIVLGGLTTLLWGGLTVLMPVAVPGKAKSRAPLVSRRRA